MDLSNIYIETKALFKCLIKSYEKFLSNKFNSLNNYFHSKKELPNSLSNNKSDMNAKSEPSQNSVTEVVRNTRLAGLPHLEAINKIIHRKIEVYNENENLIFTIEENNKELPIKVQYHNNLKHYTLLGGREAFASANEMCLYNCISDHIRIDPYVLQKTTLEQLERFVSLDAYQGVELCLGGATYTGQGPRDAATYLDNSQGRTGHKFPARAHPRGHASNPGGVGVEEYSFHGRKSGFESYQDQDFVAHYALNNATSRRSMDALNRGSIREVVHLAPYELELPRPVPAGTWVNGVRTDSFPVGTVTVVMQHHQGEYQNPAAPVFIQTMYPNWN